MLTPPVSFTPARALQDCGHLYFVVALEVVRILQLLGADVVASLTSIRPFPQGLATSRARLVLLATYHHLDQSNLLAPLAQLAAILRPLRGLVLLLDSLSRRTTLRYPGKTPQ